MGLKFTMAALLVGFPLSDFPQDFKLHLFFSLTNIALPHTEGLFTNTEPAKMMFPFHLTRPSPILLLNRRYRSAATISLTCCR